MIPKFRCFDKDTKTMHEVVSIDFRDWRVYYEAYGLRNYWSKNTLLMQSTGLKDKNGVEIFEGDIVRYTWDSPDDVNVTEKGVKTRVDKVFWSDWRASFAIGKNQLNSDLFRYIRNGNTVKVIGNIYENADLLEEK